MLGKLLERLPGGAGLLSLWERLRSSYWFVPSVMLAGSIGLAFLMLLIDDRVDTEALRSARKNLQEEEDIAQIERAYREAVTALG